MEARITRRLKVTIVGVALAATGVVLGATGAAWAQGGEPANGMTHSDGSTHDMTNCPMHQANEEG